MTTVIRGLPKGWKRLPAPMDGSSVGGCGFDSGGSSRVKRGDEGTRPETSACGPACIVWSSSRQDRKGQVGVAGWPLCDTDRFTPGRPQDLPNLRPHRRTYGTSGWVSSSPRYPILCVYYRDVVVVLTSGQRGSGPAGNARGSGPSRAGLQPEMKGMGGGSPGNGVC